MGAFEPLISIVIPVYNGADFLREAIDSALAQTYTRIEILVVNDGSTDGGATERLALGYGERIRYFSKLNGGVATALNMAIEHMHGEYFSWLSHDDLYVPEKIASQVAYLAGMEPQARGEVVLYSDFCLFTTDANQAVPVSSRPVAPESFRYSITVASAVHGCTLLIPRRAFSDVGGFDPSLRTTQDYDLWFRMAARYRFCHVPGALVKARSHANQGTVAMSDIAGRECDALTCRFIEGLGSDELRQGTGRPEVVAYAMLAAAMRYRGFSQAHRLATQHMVQGIKRAPLYDSAAACVIWLRAAVFYSLVARLRPYVPPYFRRALRAASPAMLLRVIWRYLPLPVRRQVKICLGR